MRDMKPSLIARVTVDLYNPTETWLRKTVSRYSGAFSIIVQMYAEYLVGLLLRRWVLWDGAGTRASFPVSATLHHQKGTSPVKHNAG